MLKTIEVVVVFHQARHALQRIVRQAMNLERAFGARPAATQVMMRCQLKAKAAVQCRIAQRNHRGVAKLVQGIESFIDQLTRQALPR